MEHLIKRLTDSVNFAEKEVLEQGYKRCKICLEIKLFEDFGKHSECIGGVKTLCKVCSNQQEKIKRERIKLEDKLPVKNNLKICSKCKLEKNIKNFSKKSDRKDGYMERCKQCVAQHYQKTKEQFVTSRKLYYENNKIQINNYKNN